MDRNWNAEQMPRLDEKRAIVTGANAGLGYFTALELARAGAEVIMAVRDPKRGKEARDRLLAEVPAGKVAVESLDLASLGSVRSFAALMKSGRPIDLLVNNAGVMSIPRRELTIDGYERQFATNHLGHFALTGLLLPLLLKASAPRVVSVSSGLASLARIDFDNLQSEKRYSPQGAYEVSKLANLLFMRELQRRAPARLISVGAHPGVASTDLLQSGFKWLHKRLSQHPRVGALSSLYAAAGEEVTGGDYFGPSKWFGFAGPPAKVKLPKKALDERVAEELWKCSEILTGVTFGWETSEVSALGAVG